MLHLGHQVQAECNAASLSAEQSYLHCSFAGDMAAGDRRGSFSLRLPVICVVVQQEYFVLLLLVGVVLLLLAAAVVQVSGWWQFLPALLYGWHCCSGCYLSCPPWPGSAAGAGRLGIPSTSVLQPHVTTCCVGCLPAAVAAAATATYSSM
jgi:hypothetical protein